MGFQVPRQPSRCSCCGLVALLYDSACTSCTTVLRMAAEGALPWSRT